MALLSVGGLVDGLDGPGGLAPDRHLALARAERGLLVVGQSEEGVAQDVHAQDEGHLDGRQVVGVVHEEPRLRGVDGEHPAGRTVGHEEAVVVVHDIERLRVPRLLPRPIDDVDHLEDLQEDHGVGQLAVELVLLGGVREVDDGPPDHADAADGEHLDVEVADARVQLHAHPEVVEELTVDRRVPVGRRVHSLEVGEEGKDEARDGADGDERAVVIVHERGREQVETVRPQEERANRHQRGRQRVDLVGEDVAGGRGEAHGALAGEEEVERDLEGDEEREAGPGGRGGGRDAGPEAREGPPAGGQVLERSDDGAVVVGAGAVEEEGDGGDEEGEEGGGEVAPELALEAAPVAPGLGIGRCRAPGG